MAKRHPLQNILAPLLLPLSLLYGLGGSFRRHLARNGTLRQWKPPRPCISVGNISWGGTGKTPVTDWLLSQASKRNLRAAVLTRGYGDYMRIPDPQDRVTHEPFHIVFGPNDPGPEASEEAGA